MSEVTAKEKAEQSLPYRTARFFFFMLEEIGKLIREFGMPTITVAAGITVVFVLLNYEGEDRIVYQVVVGLALVAFGLSAQVIIYFRDHPPKYPSPPPIDPALDALMRNMTQLLAEKDSPRPGDPLLANHLEDLTKIVAKAVPNSDKADE